MNSGRRLCHKTRASTVIPISGVRPPRADRLVESRSTAICMRPRLCSEPKEKRSAAHEENPISFSSVAVICGREERERDFRLCNMYGGGGPWRRPWPLSDHSLCRHCQFLIISVPVRTLGTMTSSTGCTLIGGRSGPERNGCGSLSQVTCEHLYHGMVSSVPGELRQTWDSTIDS